MCAETEVPAGLKGMTTFSNKSVPGDFSSEEAGRVGAGQGTRYGDGGSECSAGAGGVDDTGHRMTRTL